MRAVRSDPHLHFSTFRRAGGFVEQDLTVLHVTTNYHVLSIPDIVVSC